MCSVNFAKRKGQSRQSQEGKHDIQEKVRRHLYKRLNVVEYDKKYGPIAGAKVKNQYQVLQYYYK